ncbi:MAG: lipopolysaccharide heptosyltransferase II [Candidatus Omnitrophica bacterium]|nr:lipopolysaccharide heptosyltransferase II [Candidatus Omnitrophota bacterium]
MFPKGGSMKTDRILVFELNWLGDILFSFPLLRALRQKYKEAYITCVTVPRYSDLLVHNPWINYVHVMSDSTHISTLFGKLAFIRMLRAERYDVSLLLKPSRTKAVISRMSGIPERISFAGKNAPLTREVDIPHDHIHRADQLLSLAGAMGVDSADGTYEYFYGWEDREKAEAVLRKAGGAIRRIVALNPGGNWEAKRWPAERFAELGRELLNRYGDIEIMVTGAVKDIQLAQEIVSLIGAAEKCYSIAGKTSLNQLAAVFDKCALVISADSGPLHLASATGTDTIGLYGPTLPQITGPRGRGLNIVVQSTTDCVLPCYEKRCPKSYECMRSIKTREVLRAAGKVLGGKKK